MAKTEQTPAETGNIWADTASKRGYDVHNGSPLIGTILGDKGVILTVSALPGFDSVPENMRGMVLQGVLEYVQNRIAQPAAKANGATRDTVQAAVDKAMTAGYEPSRQRDKSLVDSEAERQFENYVRAKVLAAKPDASEADIAKTIAANADNKAGKEWIAAARARILESGTYTPSRKGKGTDGAAIAIEL